MKIAIISDIHANLEALTVVVKYITANKCSMVVCCGDIVGYGANPNECIWILRRFRNLKIVLGNHDAGILNKTPIRYFNEEARRAILWTRGVLGEDSFQYLNNLNLGERSYPFFICHASPDSPGSWHYIFSLEEAKYQFRFFAEPLCVIGHTHIPFAIEKSDRSYRVIKDSEFPIEKGRRYLINVGSVGQPRNGDSRASFAIYDTKANIFRFIRLEYDIKSAAEKITRAGLPNFLAERLFLGR